MTLECHPEKMHGDNIRKEGSFKALPIFLSLIMKQLHLFLKAFNYFLISTCRYIESTKLSIDKVHNTKFLCYFPG